MDGLGVKTGGCGVWGVECGVSPLWTRFQPRGMGCGVWVESVVGSVSNAGCGVSYDRVGSNHVQRNSDFALKQPLL